MYFAVHFQDLLHLWHQFFLLASKRGCFLFVSNDFGFDATFEGA